MKIEISEILIFIVSIIAIILILRFIILKSIRNNFSDILNQFSENRKEINSSFRTQTALEKTIKKMAKDIHSKYTKIK